jgi:hypothetical protein
MPAIAPEKKQFGAIAGINESEEILNQVTLLTRFYLFKL